jgi:TPR repeat protein
MPVTTIAKTKYASSKPKLPMISDDVSSLPLYVLAIGALKLGFRELAMLLAHLLVEENADATSQQLLGACYESSGWPQDNEKAFWWYQKAAENGYPKAQRAANDVLAWKREHEGKALSEYGVFNTEAFFKRRLREWTVGVTKEEKAAALKWYHDLATAGDSEAAFVYALLLLFGVGAPKNDIRAHEWVRKASRLGHLTARTIIGCLYSRGVGVQEDQTIALEWFRDAAESGHAGSQSILGNNYAGGYHVPRDFEKTAEWYKKAAAQGCDGAQERLAELYYLGRGVRRG